ncbi:hypothetical protein HPB50_005027 [Hyalomma asiaticum]|uniref:Uncharacterized protein n=1 Tax=Hyalomma asiaticum TaxID=266040 RepID=A0ACB7SMK4_HYAAI|nr:hypothetical protein HPB50_005027 [Hyalomma asiaticum]
MERISEFGETWDILLAEDYIVAKFAKPWPPELSLPDGCKLENDSLVTNQKSLVAAKNALHRGPSASRALFAGCAEFESSKEFRDAARVLLRDAEELCVVHNRNAVYTLIRMFPNIRVLSLPHDLCKHALEVYEPMAAHSPSPLMAESSELTQLLGNVEGAYTCETMERISEFGETWDILLAEDYIVAKFAKPWPPELSLPDGCKLENDSLVTNQKSLVAAKNALHRGPSASRALFAGCAEFESSKEFRDAARVLLRDAEELCVVHNRNAVYTLIRMFPNIRVLSLPHDLCKHALEVYEPMAAHSPSPLMAESSELTQLLGNVEGMGTRGLVLSEETVRAVLLTCPRLRRIDSDMVLEAVLRNDTPLESTRSTTMYLTHLALHRGVFDSGGQVTSVGPVDVVLAARTFPLVEDLEVRTELASSTSS